MFFFSVGFIFCGRRLKSVRLVLNFDIIFIAVKKTRLFLSGPRQHSFSLRMVNFIIFIIVAANSFEFCRLLAVPGRFVRRLGREWFSVSSFIR